MRRPPAQAVVIFGASGDLARRKILPALYNLYVRDLLPEHFAIVGYSTADWDDDAFRGRARTALAEYSRTPMDDEAFGRFADLLSFVSGRFDDPIAIRALRDRLAEVERAAGTEGGRLYYLAVPPPAFPTIVRSLGAEGLGGAATRIVVEKPFGSDLESARELTVTLHATFDESQVFRIDHYLGKETVQNIFALRFANAIFERLWNRDAIDHVELTVAEEIGLQGRAKYYEGSGAIRDLFQNHLLQMLSFLAMEPPRSLDPEAIRDEKVKLLCAVRPLRPEDVVRGQYEGYLEEPGVAKGSTTPTYVAARLAIDNWRWAGVPFYLRHGKLLAKRATEITVTFRDAPSYLFAGIDPGPLTPNHLTIRVQPDEGISLAFLAKEPGNAIKLKTVRMDFDYDRSFRQEPAEAYERLVHDAMSGDHTLFTRADGVERSWEIVAPVLDDADPVTRYSPGSWGPEGANALIAPHRWHLGDDS